MRLMMRTQERAQGDVQHIAKTIVARWHSKNHAITQAQEVAQYSGPEETALSRTDTNKLQLHVWIRNSKDPGATSTDPMHSSLELVKSIHHARVRDLDCH